MKTLLLAALSLLPAARPAPAAQDGITAARAWRSAHEPAILRELAGLLGLPNVSADRAGVRANAEAIAALFAQRGCELAVHELADANPVLIGRLDSDAEGGAARTIGIYVHYDGQPVVPEQWTDPPFVPTLRTAAIEDGGERRALPADGEAVEPEWRLYARAAGDDKAPLVAWLAAIDALKAAGVPRTANLVFLFDGEEEIGSPNLGRYMREHVQALKADFWLVFDGPVHQSRRPQLVFGVRGVTGFELTVYGAARNLHSGHYGNWAPSAGAMLARLIASMRADDGQVLIPRFYDTVEPLSEAERAALATVPNIDAELRSELGLARVEGDLRLEGMLLRPSLNVRGLACGAVGDAARNVIPNEATASFDIRLVPGNDPEQMLDLVEAHVRKQGYHIVREPPSPGERRNHARIALVKRGGGYGAVRTPADHPTAALLVAAVKHATGEPPILLPSMGGSLPLYLFRDILGAPPLIVPIANHDDNQHAPDENLRLANLWYGVDVCAALLGLP